MQVLKSSTSMLTTMSRFVARDGTLSSLSSRSHTHPRPGIPSLWAGLSASILRQATYSTARFGIHAALAAHVLERSPGRDTLPLSWNIACAGLAGGLAGLMGNPTEVVLVRMCADGAKLAAERFAYANALTGLGRVWTEEGVQAFKKGLAPNVARSILMSMPAFVRYRERG